MKSWRILTVSKFDKEIVETEYFIEAPQKRLAVSSAIIEEQKKGRTNIHAVQDECFEMET
jgi:hypothetical protein